MAFQFNLKPSSIAGSLDSFSFDQTDNKAPTATTESASRQLLDSKKPEPKAAGPGRNSALLASIDDIGLDDSSAADGAAAAPSASSIFLQEKRAAQAEAAALAARAAAQPAPAAAAPAPKSARDDRMLQLIEQHSRDQQDIVISRKQKGKELSKAQRKRKEKAQERGANYSGQQSGKQQVRPPPPGHAVCCRFCLHANQPAPRSPAIQAKEASTKAGQKPVLNQPAWWQWLVSRPPPPPYFQWHGIQPNWTVVGAAGVSLVSTADASLPASADGQGTRTQRYYLLSHCFNPAKSAQKTNFSSSLARQVRALHTAAFTL
jgi:hypothetical protein